jgi:hypothetical protein
VQIGRGLDVVATVDVDRCGKVSIQRHGPGRG